MTTAPFSVSVVDGIAKAVLDLPGEPVNKITAAVRTELDALLSRWQSDPAVKAVVLLSGKTDTFIAGADIDEFVKLGSQEEAEALVRAGQILVSRLGQIGKPVVAAIHGACLGGGLEAALACAYRIASDHPKTTLGLPEIQLGIIPAAGGCQRLPRLIGPRAALDLILTGKSVPAFRAFRLGMVNELVHPAILENVAVTAARRLATGWRPPRRPAGVAGWLLDRNPLGRAVVFRMAGRALARKAGRHYPAPAAALDAVRTGLRRGIAAGLEREARAFGELAVGDVSRNLVRIFFASTALKKDPGIAGTEVKPQPVRRLAVVGAGFMGAAIGGVAALQAQVDVRLKDTDLERVGKGLTAAGRLVRDRLTRRRISKYEYERLAALISGGVDWRGLASADLVIEAIFEDLDVKRRLFEELERHTSDGCVLASNTSTIPIARIAEGLERPDRVLGMHFFSPVDRMPLLEVIVTDRTAPRAIVTAVAFGKKMGKTVVVVRDRPGFWVNRLLSPYLNEAGRMIGEGGSIEMIEQVATDFGFPVGPVTLMDEVGLDVLEKAGGVMHGAFGDRMAPVPGIGKLVAAGRLGRKSGAGFFRYARGRKRQPDPQAIEAFGISAGWSELDPADVRERLVYSMLNEAALALEERVVRSARDGDMAAIFGFGFPPFRGGPLRYIDTLGAEQVVATLQRLSAKLGPRFSPAPLLQQLAATGGRLDQMVND